MARGNFGERLHRERELREVSLSEVTKATCIGTRFLEALENEEWGKLPGGVFNRGFVRAIARYLGLDEEALLAEYDLAHGPEPLQVANSFPIPQIGPPRWVFPAVALIALLALGAAGFFGWRWYAARRRAHHAAAQQQQNRTPNTQSTVPVSSAPQAPSVSPAASSESAGAADTSANGDSPLLLIVSVSAATRVRVVADGNAVLDAELHAGDNRHFTAQNGFLVSAGDSSAVLLELNGQAMPPIGAPGTSGTIPLSRKDLRPAPSGSDQPGTN